jgi:hypothetical protein
VPEGREELQPSVGTGEMLLFRGSEYEFPPNE